jgi:hypothetical protein
VKAHAPKVRPAAGPGAFAMHARAALEKQVPEARTSGAHWVLGANQAWVRFPRLDGLHGYAGLRRHLDWVNGEAGVSREPRDLAELFLLPGQPPGDVPGFRIRLGDLMHAENRWWPAGDTERELVQRLEFLALQLAVKAPIRFRRWPGEDR